MANRYSLKDMQILAKEKGGKCLSKEYINSKTHLLWRCNKGHEWSAIPSKIIMGEVVSYLREKEINKNQKVNF